MRDFACVQLVWRSGLPTTCHPKEGTEVGGAESLQEKEGAVEALL
jgi:hypothetical protein